ncbi:MAG: branched-chain amino acid ABC transporter permease, partial [Betaproteobacteria bacterium]|nr:branched-chain amino acid ABC transporter permease [Betaproteobacteria bacterium]
MSVLKRYLLLRRSDALGMGSLVVLVLLLPHFAGNDYYLNLMILALLYAGLASSWNIVGGIAGQFSLGHTAFFGIGA